MTPFNILLDATVTGFGSNVSSPLPSAGVSTRSFQAAVEGVNPAAVVRVYGCNDGRFPILIGTITLSATGTTYATDVLSDDTPFEVYAGEVVSLSAGAKVSLIGCI